MEKLDILVFAAHPDDAELGCGGTIIKQIQQGDKVGIADLTEGQLGTRGSVALRYREAAKAAEILQLTLRENLRMMDGFFENNRENRLKVIQTIRKYRPDVVLCNAVSDRHPDHGRGSLLVSEACFYSGLKAIVTEWEGKPQAHWRPGTVYHYIQDRFHKPDFVVDVSDQWEQRMKAVQAYGSQFYNPADTTPETPISGADFLEFVDGRGREFGRSIGAKYGEGFLAERYIGVNRLQDLK